MGDLLGIHLSLRPDHMQAAALGGYSRYQDDLDVQRSSSVCSLAYSHPEPLSKMGVGKAKGKNQSKDKGLPTLFNEGLAKTKLLALWCWPVADGAFMPQKA